MQKEQDLIFEAYLKAIRESEEKKEEENCDAAEEGCDCNGCEKCKDNQKVEEAKLDPVGKEDEDVNNDGKEDETDEYILKRREAIKKSIHGEGQEIAKEYQKVVDGGVKVAPLS